MTFGRTVRASAVPWKRVSELWVHMVDLDLGLTFDDVPAEVAERLIGEALAFSQGACPSVHLTVGDRAWDITGAGPVHNVTGTPGWALAWVTGRGASGVTCDVPDLPAWL